MIIKPVQSVLMALSYKLQFVLIVRQMIKTVSIAQQTIPAYAVNVSNHIHFKKENVFHALIIVVVVFLVHSVHPVAKTFISSRINLGFKQDYAVNVQKVVKIVLILLIKQGVCQCGR